MGLSGLTNRILLGLALAFSVLFLAFPEIDLWANGLFYESDGGFLLKGNPVFDFVHRYVGVIVWVLLLGSLLIWLPLGLTTRYKHLRRAAVFVVLVLIVGPGLLVNALFKDQWGRARPSQVENFGGTAQFTPPWIMTNQCKKNCSFVCGDASVGFALIALAFVSRRPRLWMSIGLFTGGVLGVMRMGQGGHFFSDVIFSFFTVYFAAWLLHRLLFPSPPLTTPRF